MRDPAANRQARVLRWYGIDRDGRKPANGLGYYDFDITSVGFGYHMTNIAAAIGLENLKQLAAQKSHRQAVVDRYREAFRAVPGVTLFDRRPDRESSNHFFTMHVETRDGFCRKMKESGIDVSIVHYRNDAYSVFGGLRKDLPELDRFDRTYIGLPAHMHLMAEDVEYVVDAVRSGW